MKKETLHQEISISPLDIYKVKFPYNWRETNCYNENKPD